VLQHPWLAQRVNLTAGLLGTVRTYSSFSDRPRGRLHRSHEPKMHSERMFMQRRCWHRRTAG